MKKLTVKLENCYGIRKLDEDFDFSGSKVNLIYAKNGMIVKTSFSKVFEKYQKGKQDKSKIKFLRKPETFFIEGEGDWLGKKGNKENPEDKPEEKNKGIFVIKSFDESYLSQNIKSTLIREEYKKEYDEKIKILEEEKSSFLEKVKTKMRYIQEFVDSMTAINKNVFKYLESNKRIEEEFLDLFGETESKSRLDFYRKISEIGFEEYVNKSNIVYADIKYAALLFNDKTLKGAKPFLKTYKNVLRSYIEIYLKVVAESEYFDRKFNHQNAEKILSDLENKYSYFKPGDAENKNGFRLFNRVKSILKNLSKEELDELVKKIKSTFKIESSGLGVALDNAIDNNKELKELKEYLFEINLDFLDEFKSDSSEGVIDSRQKLFLSLFLNFMKKILKNFIGTIRPILIEIEDIVKKIKKDGYLWQSAIDKFNQRFSVPFYVYIEDGEFEKLINSEILDDIPLLKYGFCDGDDEDKEKCIRR